MTNPAGINSYTALGYPSEAQNQPQRGKSGINLSTRENLGIAPQRTSEAPEYPQEGFARAG